MTHRPARGALTVLAVLALGALAGPAAAATTPTAVLDCGTDTHVVSGFGRGQVLHVEGSRARFVVTSAWLADGRLVFDAPGQDGTQTLVTCTTTAPGGTAFVFEGFFTPRG